MVISRILDYPLRTIDLIAVLDLEMFCSPAYNISITQIRVGTSLIDVDLTALFDSGTSFTYLVDPAYTRLSESVSACCHQTQKRGLCVYTCLDK